MDKKISFYIVSFLLIVLLLNCVCSKEKSNQDTIKIGGIYALTGKVASYGKWIKNGVDLAVEQINKKGGINGHKIEIFEEDTQSEPKVAASALEKVISIYKVPVAIGFITSSEFLACAPIAERTKTVMITPIASAPLERPEGSYIFRTRESGPLQSKKVAEYIFKTLGIKKASIIYENAANAISYRDAFIEGYESLGGKVDQVLSYEEGQTDYRAILSKLQAQPVKAVYIPGVGKVIGRLLKQAKELGIQTRFFSSAGIEDPELFKIAGDAADGVIFGAPAFSLDDQTEPSHSFIESYRKKFGEDPSVYSANAYDAIMLVINAIRAGNSKSETIKDYFYSIKNYTGVSGKITFDKYGEVIKPIVLKTSIKGTFVLLDDSSQPIQSKW